MAQPAINTVTFPAGNYLTGQAINLTLTYSEAVDVTGSPEIVLRNCNKKLLRVAVYFSGTGTNAIVFRYTVQAGDLCTPDDATQLNGVQASAIDLLPGESMKNLAGTENALTLFTTKLHSNVWVNDPATIVDFANAGDFSWDVPAGVRTASMECWGGGGTGGAGRKLSGIFKDKSGVGGDGGGGGAYAKAIVDVSAAVSYAVRVGVGGIGTDITFGNPVPPATAYGGATIIGSPTVVGADIVCKAAGGSPPTIGGVPGVSSGLGGSVADCVGSTKYAGGRGGIADPTAAAPGGAGGGGGSSGLTDRTGLIGGQNLVGGFGSGAKFNGGNDPDAGNGGDSGLGGSTTAALKIGSDGTIPGGGGGGGGGGGLLLSPLIFHNDNGLGGSGQARIRYRATIRAISIEGPVAGDYGTGQDLGFACTFDQAVDIEGTPRIALTIGGNTRYATYVSGTGTALIHFAYEIVGGDLAATGISSAAVIDLNSGTIRSTGDLVSDMGLDFVAPDLSAVFVNRSGTETFSTAGAANWTCPVGVISIVVECWGGGGGGTGGSGVAGAIGGGGGAYAKKNSLTVVPGNVYPYVVGAAGSAGGAGVNGGAGTDTTFNTTSCVAKAGNGGAGAGIGGQASGCTGDVKFSGGDTGTAGNLSGCGGGSSGGTAADGGNGGNSGAANGGAAGTAPSGGGAGGRGGDTAANAGLTAGTAPGGGGGGGAATFTGAAGAAGKIKLTYAGALATLSPRVLHVTPPADATVFTGNALDFTVVYNEAVTVTGTPRIALTVGETARYATYASGTGTASLVFSYTVVPGDTDDDAVGCVLDSPIDLNGGSLANASAVAAALTFTEPDVDDLFVNYLDPAVDPPPTSSVLYGLGKRPSSYWICPKGVTSVQVECWGPGSSGNGTTGSNPFIGGGGGAYAKKTITVVPGTQYLIVPGKPDSGDDATFQSYDGRTTYVKAARGLLNGNGGLGSDSIGTTTHDGGNGGSGVAARTDADDEGRKFQTDAGGGGGGSAGTAATGNNGTDGTDNGDVATSGPGGVAVTGGGKGGDGSGRFPTQGSFPGGGGGGSNQNAFGANGAGGKVALTWTPAVPVIISATATKRSYYAGDTVVLTVTFDQSVTVVGVPTIAFRGLDGKADATSRTFDYSSGSGSAVLLFEYDVQSIRLDLCGNPIVIANKIVLNGGTIRNAGAQDAALNFAAPSPSGILLNFPLGKARNRPPRRL